MEGGHDLLCVHVVVVAVLAHVGVLRPGVAVDDVLGYHAALPAAQQVVSSMNGGTAGGLMGPRRTKRTLALHMIAQGGRQQAAGGCSSSRKHAAALGRVLLCS